ncbi:MAG: hypothetical protein KC983_12755, partial [Phycisphaerales bacterium]|nr:hypothetical protein [Phycisphaerales bacterium]
MIIRKRFIEILAMATLVAGGLTGCARLPYAAQDSTRTDEDLSHVARLDAPEQAEAVQILASVAEGHIVTGPSAFRSEFPRGRWSDVPAAALDACDQCELAIFGTEVGTDDRGDVITFT